MTPGNALKRIAAFPRTNGRATLARMSLLCRYLGDPQNKMKYIHIAGTNGKGSVAAMTDVILRCAGYKVGRYISPYILDFRERMTVDGKMIPFTELPIYTKKVLAAVSKMESDIAAAKWGENVNVPIPEELLTGEIPSTPVQFEIVTAIAFLFFLECRCDIVVLECGLGGRYDATNVIPAPLAAVLCGIGIDHAELLGDTCAKIAEEKSGIIKKGTGAVISAPQVTDALLPISERCRALDCALTVAGKADVVRSGPLGLEFAYKGELYDLALCAAYQATNASVVLEIVRALGELGMTVPARAVKGGFMRAHFPARFEVLSISPTVIVDGAHNEHGIIAFCKSVRAMSESLKGDVTFAISMLRDKEPSRALAPFAELALSGEIKVREIKAFSADNPRSMPAAELAQILEALTCGRISVDVCDSAKTVASKVLSGLDRKDSLISLGSLYGASELREAILEKFG